MQHVVKIKGGKDGLRIIIDEAADWQDVLAVLNVQFEQAGSFFSGAHMVVEIGDRQVSEQELRNMLTLMQKYGLQPDSLATTIRESRVVARAMGLPTKAMPQIPSVATAQTESDATLVCRTVRSGQIVRHPGHITLIGDVNPGAEIIAGGSVVVWGRLRGLVHAGALGDARAIVCALDLRPTQLRIANVITRTPDGEGSTMPEVAHIEEGNIVVELWEEYKREPSSSR